MWRHFAGRDFPLEGFSERLFPAEGFGLGGISPHSHKNYDSIDKSLSILKDCWPACTFGVKFYRKTFLEANSNFNFNKKYKI